MRRVLSSRMPVQGASIGGIAGGASGMYSLEATRGESIKSNAVTIVVVVVVVGAVALNWLGIACRNS